MARGALGPVLLVAVGVGRRTLQQRRSGQGKQRQALDRALLGLAIRGWPRSAVGACLGEKGLNQLLDSITPHHRITDANKFSFSNYNFCQELDCCLSIQILFST